MRSFCFCRHLCTVLSPATPHCSNGTRLLTGSPCPAAGGRKRGAVSRKKYRVQRPLQGQLHDNISDRSQVREYLSLCYFCTTTSSTGSSCSYLAVTLLSLRDISPVRGISAWGAKKRSHDVRSFCFCRHLCTVLSPATSHRSNGMRLLSVAEKQSGELFCRCDTMRQRQLPTTYSKSQVRAARTSQSPFCHSVTFPLSGESLFEAP